MSARLKTRVCLASLFLVGGVLAAPAYAQYVGPTEKASDENTIAAILAYPIDDQPVTMQGQILRKIGKEKYIFSDGTAEIVAEIDDDVFPDEPVDEQIQIEIRGEVDTGLRRPPEIEVDSMRVVK